MPKSPMDHLTAEIPNSSPQGATPMKASNKPGLESNSFCPELNFGAGVQGSSGTDLLKTTQGSVVSRLRASSHQSPAQISAWRALRPKRCSMTPL